MNKKILFIAGTHGNEPIGVNLSEELSKRQTLRSLYKSVIGNPLALAQNKRFIEEDLNRVAPGNQDSPIYERRRAAELVEMFKSFDYVIDFHETKANNRIVIILPQLNRESLALALALDIDNVLIWPSTSLRLDTGPLVQYAPFGLEIECGTKNSFERTLGDLVEVADKFLTNGIAQVEKNLSLSLADLGRKKFYFVYGRIDPSEVEHVDLQDFVEVNTGKETFIPLLFGRHQGLKGYKVRTLDNTEVFDMISSGNVLHKT